MNIISRCRALQSLLCPKSIILKHGAPQGCTCWIWPLGVNIHADACKYHTTTTLSHHLNHTITQPPTFNTYYSHESQDRSPVKPSGTGFVFTFICHMCVLESRSVWVNKSNQCKKKNPTHFSHSAWKKVSCVLATVSIAWKFISN